MDIEIKLPKISDSIKTVIVTDILVSEGDTVEAEDSLITVESEKASLEVPSEQAGVVKKILVKEGDEIKIGATIVILEGEAGAASQEEEEKEEKAPAKEIKAEDSTPKQEEKKEEKEESREEIPSSAKQEPVPSDAAGSASHSTDKTIPVSPLARKIARESGVDLQALMASTDKSRITVDDVRRAASGGPTVASGPLASGVAAIPVPDFSKWGSTRREKLTTIRKITAKNTAFSWQTMPHVTHFDEADITDLEAFRKKYNTKNKSNLTITAILLKICGLALQKFPSFNASLDAGKEEIIYKEYYHIGVAADTKDGLLMPVVQSVNAKGILQMADELSEMAGKARERKLHPDQMEGQTFVISNLGGIGGIGFTPVVFPNNAAILGVSRASIKPVFDKESGTFVPRLIAPLCVSYDHRVIDGAEAARFMRWICEGLEQPVQLLL